MKLIFPAKVTMLWDYFSKEKVKDSNHEPILTHISKMKVSKLLVIEMSL